MYTEKNAVLDIINFHVATFAALTMNLAMVLSLVWPSAFLTFLYTCTRTVRVVFCITALAAIREP